MNSAEDGYQFKELTAAEYPFTYCFPVSFFFLFHSEIHERSNPLCEERLPCFRNWVGDTSPRISSLGLRLCWPPVAAFTLHPQRQEDYTAQDVLCDAQHDGVRPRKQVGGGYSGSWGFAFALYCLWPFQHWGWWAGAGNGLWLHRATQQGASEHWFGMGGVWAIWCRVQLLGCARETFQRAKPTFFLEIESQVCFHPE